MKGKELIRDLAFFGVFIFLIILFRNFILDNMKIFLIIFVFFLLNITIIIMVHGRKYGGKNFPYKPYKSKKKINERILIGLLAGLHYFFFIGTYNHKKYNTQVWYPETLECVFGNISQIIILIIYALISINLFNIIGYYSLIFMAVPIITNIISLKYKKEEKQSKKR